MIAMYRMLFIVVILLGFMACEPRPAYHRIPTLSDLKIPDPERAGILKMHIAATSGFDTNYQYMFMHPEILNANVPYKKAQWFRVTDTFPVEELVRYGDDRKYYDSFGNITFQKLSTNRMCGYYPANTAFRYTENGLQLRAWGGNEPDSFVHKWDIVGNRLLTIRWVRMRYGSDDTLILADSTLSYFDSSYKLTMTVSRNPEQWWGEMFYYDTGGHLVERRWKNISGKNRLLKKVTTYKYVNNILFSSVSDLIDQYRGDGSFEQEYINEYFYDENGIVKDSRVNIVHATKNGKSYPDASSDGVRLHYVHLYW